MTAYHDMIQLNELRERVFRTDGPTRKFANAHFAYLRALADIAVRGFELEQEDSVVMTSRS
jgi:hypothetical protein